MDWDDEQVIRRAAGAVFGLVVFSLVLAVTKTKLKRTQTRGAAVPGQHLRPVHGVGERLIPLSRGLRRLPIPPGRVRATTSSAPGWHPVRPIVRCRYHLRRCGLLGAGTARRAADGRRLPVRTHGPRPSSG